MTFEIQTERLVLRPLAAADADAHIAMMDDERVARFLTLAQKPDSYGVSWRNFASMLGHWQIRGFGFFSVFERAADGRDGPWVGRVGPWMPAGWPSLEVGWGISADYWGRGYAPEAAVAAMRWVFDTYPDLDKIISLIDPDNVNSQAVAAKVGESNSGETFPLETLMLDIWSVTRERWFRQFG